MIRSSGQVEIERPARMSDKSNCSRVTTPSYSIRNVSFSSREKRTNERGFQSAPYRGCFRRELACRFSWSFLFNLKTSSPHRLNHWRFLIIFYHFRNFTKLWNGQLLWATESATSTDVHVLTMIRTYPADPAGSVSVNTWSVITSS